MGIPQDAYREIKLLKEISRFPNENIVKLERVYMSKDSDHAAMLNLVYSYAEHDLAEIIRFHRTHSPRPLPFSPKMIKSIMWQILQGVNFLHQNWIIHRDISNQVFLSLNLAYDVLVEPANILILDNCEPNMQGVVQIADFGLARIYQDPLRPLCDDGDVVTIWYRAPELLLGSKHYTRAIDIWAIGAIFGELFHLSAIFPGKDNPQRGALQTDQLERIFFLLGKPTPDQWVGLEHCPFYKEIKDWENKEFQSRLAEVLRISKFSKAFDLLSSMLQFDPNKRITAEQALEHPYFKENPQPNRNCFLDHNDRRVEYPSRDFRLQQEAARQQHK